MASGSSVEIVVHLKNDTSSDNSSDVNAELQDLDMQENKPTSAERSCKMREIEVSNIAVYVVILAACIVA